MKMYFKIIIISLISIIAVNIIYSLANSYQIGKAFLYLLLAISICGITSVIVTVTTRILPEKVFSPYRRIFKVYKKENKLYTKLKIKKWKDKVPELGKLGGFAKNHINEPNNPQYIFKFLTETCIAETLHFYSILLGSLVFVFLPSRYLFTISIPVFLLNGFLHLLPVLIQRYVRPKFLKVYQRLIEKEQQDSEEDLSLKTC